MQKRIAEKAGADWQKKYPLLNDIAAYKEVFWENSRKQSFAQAVKGAGFSIDDIFEAKARFERFAPFFQEVFPETVKVKGFIESPLQGIPAMKQRLETFYGNILYGELLLKGDHELAGAGSIKARGGFHEVIKLAEELALDHKRITKNDDYRVFHTDSLRSFFQQYTLVVGSTGNLGLSIGMIGKALGFQVTVHMSADAKQWKKDHLSQLGVQVVEHTEDYGKAVKEGRKMAQNHPHCFFIDDERSVDLFLGYAAAAFHLKEQLNERGIQISKEQPLIVYIPCGVGGGPGGVAFGLKMVFEDNVHCYFAEPTHSPSMLIGMMTGQHDAVSVYDLGLDNQTEADGLAVAAPSAFVGRLLDPFLSGIYTVDDDTLLQQLRFLVESEHIFLEPSAAAGLSGPFCLMQQGFRWTRAVHVVWATGGSLVPSAERGQYDERAKKRG
ncbi:D-serine ammonia-lyase [Alteribacillus persepolensis]|uniref:Probable D-serine dehydratase n=1 Tax=Alteribacillus persepolensis TaxID=568899 RepID=A0A1G8GDN4_9BACI|nr:D-serine ammonia-lyase [Alteribacillus persepolensis]SDH92514.1 D-serine ammonia-lyase [Alteribacillus persepolensis]